MMPAILRLGSPSCLGSSPLRSIGSDGGKHTIAAVVTDKWLEFSAWRGNDLATPQGSFPGLTEGCRWCLCVSRWKESFDARAKFGDGIVPLVDLRATHVSPSLALAEAWRRMRADAALSQIDALKTVRLEDLQAFSLDKSAGGGGGKSEL